MSVKNTFVHIEAQKPEIRRSKTVGTFTTANVIKKELCISPCASLASLSTADSLSTSNESVTAPRGKGRLGRFARKNAEETMTTIMIRNIPCRYTPDSLMEEVKEISTLFNFFYMPVARKTQGSLGYAFVNFVDEDEAARFMTEFQGHAFAKQPNSTKRADAIYAVLQGFEKNVKFFQRAKISKSKFRPFVNRNLSA